MQLEQYADNSNTFNIFLILILLMLSDNSGTDKKFSSLNSKLDRVSSIFESIKATSDALESALKLSSGVVRATRTVK